MLNNLGLANKVKLHLTYSVQWSNIITLVLDHVRTVPLDPTTVSSTYTELLNPNKETYVLKGTNPKNEKAEYVLPISKRAKVTLENLDLVFTGIERVEENEFGSIEKILVAIVDTDGSILFYYVSRGVKNYTE
jgi:hypothetical protein